MSYFICLFFCLADPPIIPFWQVAVSFTIHFTYLPRTKHYFHIWFPHKNNNLLVNAQGFQIKWNILTLRYIILTFQMGVGWEVSVNVYHQESRFISLVYSPHSYRWQWGVGLWRWNSLPHKREPVRLQYLVLLKIIECCYGPLNIIFFFPFSSFCLAVCPSRPPPCRSCVSSAKEVQALHVVALFYTDI